MADEPSIDEATNYLHCNDFLATNRGAREQT